MRSINRDRVVLAIYLNSRGFGFVVFEGPSWPIDWGMKEVRHERTTEAILPSVAALIEHYKPDILVLQDTSSHGTQRIDRIKVINAAIADLAGWHSVPVCRYSSQRVRESFGHWGPMNKERLAAEIAKYLPQLQRYEPGLRKPWMSEDARMGMFDAAALALTFFHAESGYVLGGSGPAE